MRIRIDWTGGDMTLAIKTTVLELSIIPQLRDAVPMVAAPAAPPLMICRCR